MNDKNDKQKIISFQVLKKDEGKKLKEFLNMYLEESKSRIRNIIKRQCVKVNNETKKARYILVENDVIEINENIGTQLQNKDANQRFKELEELFFESIEDFNYYPSKDNYNRMIKCVKNYRIINRILYEKSHASNIMTSYGNIKGKSIINYPNYYEWVLKYDNSNLVSEEINEEFNILNEKLFEKRHLTEENEIKLYEILKRGFYPSNKKNQKNLIEYINWKKAIPEDKYYIKNKLLFYKKNNKDVAQEIRKRLSKTKEDLDSWVKPVGKSI